MEFYNKYVSSKQTLMSFDYCTCIAATYNYVEIDSLLVIIGGPYILQSAPYDGFFLGGDGAYILPYCVQRSHRKERFSKMHKQSYKFINLPLSPATGSI